MTWPLSQDYNEAIQDPRPASPIPELQGGEADTNALGMPMPRSGNFADVYDSTARHQEQVGGQVLHPPGPRPARTLHRDQPRPPGRQAALRRGLPVPRAGHSRPRRVVSHPEDALGRRAAAQRDSSATTSTSPPS